MASAKASADMNARALPARIVKRTAYAPFTSVEVTEFFIFKIFASREAPDPGTRGLDKLSHV